MCAGSSIWQMLHEDLITQLQGTDMDFWVWKARKSAISTLTAKKLNNLQNHNFTLNPQRSLKETNQPEL